MRRPVFRRANTSMSLFPFLAVLICTMGSLIVLLVLVLQQARVQASTEAAAPTASVGSAPESAVDSAADAEAVAKLEKTLREEREDHDWRREILTKQRAEQAELLSNTRLELSHLEDHLRRLEEQAKLIQAQLVELDKLAAPQSEQSPVREDLQKILAAIEIAKKELEEARERIAKKPRTYAIIPYEGPNGTKRRPIYIECTETGIVLHPEGVLFLPNDFSGPLGPGNPLDAALRTVREYLVKTGGTQRDGEPYPLLIIRPSGAVAYSMARAAMASWDEEFGYELVDEEMKLTFPPADPQLEELLMRTLKDARSRQAALAAAMPSRFKGELPSSFSSNTPQGPSSLAAERSEGGGNSFSGGSGIGGGGGQGGLSGSSGRGFGRNSPGGSNTNPLGGNGMGSVLGGTGTGSGDSSGNFAAGLNAGTDGQGAGNGTGTGASGGVGSSLNGPVNGSPGAGGNGGTTGNVAGRPGSSGANGGGAAGGGGASGGAASGSLNGGGMSAANGSSANGSEGGSSGAAGLSANAGSSRMASSGGSQTSSGKPVTSLAKSKGTDWALPKKAQNATGITRPIRVQCFQDRLVIVPERGDDARPQTIRLKNGFVSGSVEEFVSGIWRRTDDWGLAVAGGYWKPVLKVEVAPGAEGQFAELEILLRGSGLEVQRK